MLDGGCCPMNVARWHYRCPPPDPPPPLHVGVGGVGGATAPIGDDMSNKKPRGFLRGGETGFGNGCRSRVRGLH